MAARGWTAYRLWQESGVSQQHIGRLLRAQRSAEGLAHDTLRKLAGALEVRAEWLATGEGEMRGARVPRLRDRPEWIEVVEAVRSDHPEMAAEDLERVGAAQDEAEVFRGRLDATLVYSVALAIREWHRRARA